MSAQTGALLGQELPWPGSHWADNEGVFIITILGQFHLPDGVYHALERATAQAKFRGKSLRSSSQNVASASQHGYVPTSTIRQPLHKRLKSRGSLYDSGQSLFLTILRFSCDSPAKVQTETLQQPMPCDELCFRASVWWVREVNLLIFVLHTRRLTLSQDLNHCLVKQLEHDLWNLMVQVVLTLWLIVWIWAQVLLSNKHWFLQEGIWYGVFNFLHWWHHPKYSLLLSILETWSLFLKDWWEIHCANRVFWPLEQNEISLIKMRWFKGFLPHLWRA